MPDIEIYIGSLIEHPSDRAVLERLAELLSGGERDAVILANVQLGGRQIDLVLALDGLTLVIEAKSSANPLRGGTNGPWEVRVASGDWKPIGNYYVQTLEAAYALRDAMNRFVSAHVGYPRAALVFVPSIPPGSEICQSDYKVSITGLEGVETLLRATRQGYWSLDQWRRFVGQLRLTRVGNVAAAFDTRLAAAEGLIDRYVTAFQRTYGPLAAELIPFDCTREGEPVSSNHVVDQGAAGASMLLRGPSGCGKTLLAYHIALAAAERGRVPILILAQDFAGNLRDAVHHETALLDAPSAEALIKACQRLSRPISLIVDGYNECIERERGRLTRSIRAAIRRYGASILITSQTAPERAELLDLRETCVPPPDTNMKCAIACRASGIILLDPALQPLIDSVESGLEARLIGETGRDLSPQASRFAIFDAFVRRKLGDDAYEGIRALARVAQLLTDRVSFSLSVRDLDRLAEQEAIPPGLLRRLAALRLLITRGGRASFAHELFFSAFAAEAVIRRAAGSATEILQALQSPRHADRKVLIVGAIDDDSLLASILPEIADPELIEACLAGQCGAIAYAWASTRCAELFKRIRAEADQAMFALSDTGFLGLAPDESSLLVWTPQDRAFLQALGTLGSEGVHLDEILDVVTAMDRRLDQEYARLRAAAREHKIALRSALFANAYVLSRSLGIGRVCETLHLGRFRDPRRHGLASLVYERITRTHLSNGQLFVLLALSRHTFREQPSLAPLLPQLLREHFSGAPYHLQLDLLDAAKMCGLAGNAERRAIIDVLQELPQPRSIGISGSLVDALKSLGALDDHEAGYARVVRSQIREALSDQDNPDMQALAHGAWFAQFDHPYERAYYEAIAELSEEDRKALLVMAAKGTGLDAAFFVSVLITDLAACGDPATGPIISRWTAVPAVDSFLPQDAINIFATAHIALARLGCPLPEVDGIDSPAQEALTAAGQILYWLNRRDLPIAERRAACVEGLATLSRHELGVSAGVLAELQWACRPEGLDRLPGTEPVHPTIGDAFGAEVAEICRQALRRPENQSGYFNHSSIEKILDFAAAALGRWGGPADIAFLRQFSNHRTIGSAAIRAIRELEQTLNA